VHPGRFHLGVSGVIIVGTTTVGLGLEEEGEDEDSERDIWVAGKKL
jgi:hypothetical protein